MAAPPKATLPSTPSRSRQIKANPLPVVVSGAILAISAASVFVIGPSDVLLGAIAYLLTAVGSALCVAWDSLAQRRGMKDPNFTPSRSQQKLLQLLALAGVVLAVFHIIRVVETAAEYLSELWGLV